MSLNDIGNGAEPARPCGRDGQRLREQLRPIALHVEAAALLERRAKLSGNRVLAALLAERAARHRQAAERVRCTLGLPGSADDGDRASVL